MTINNAIVLSGDVAWYDISAYRVRGELDRKTGDIEIHLSTDVFEGIEIHNIIREYSKSKGKVTIVNIAKCFSIGAFIYAAGDIRKAYENSSIMIHKSWSWAMGNAEDMIQRAEVLNGIDAVQNSTYSKFSNTSYEEMNELLSKETWYIGKDRLAESGMVSEFIEDDLEIVDAMSAKSTFESMKTTMSAKAESEKRETNFASVKASLLICTDGKCPSSLVAKAAPTDTVKSASSIQENDMTKEEFLASEDGMELVASHKKEVDGFTAAKTDLKIASDSLAKAEEKITAQSTWQDQLPEVCAMAISKKVDEKTLVAMVTSNDMTSAKAAVMDGMQSEGTFGAGQTNTTTQSSNPWAGHFNNNKEK